MLSLKSGKLKPAGWMGEMSKVTARFLLTAQEMTGAGSAEISLKEWIRNIQGLDLVIKSSKEYDPDWIYRVRTLGRATIKSVSTFRTRLQAAVDRLISGGADAAFIATFARSIDVELTKAWNEGADAIGVAPDEMTDEDVKQLGAIIDNEDNYISGVADAIREDQLNEMTEEALASKYSARVDVWANRYPDVVNRAMLWFGQKKRMIWTIGDREKHCRTCPRLNGIVAFGYEWDASGFHPQRPPNDMLECKGFKCGCGCKPTTKRRSVNALKKLQAIAGGG
jgi:hypothetical protein